MAEDTSQAVENTEGDESVARPYARAIFELARQEGNYSRWNDELALMAAVMRNETVRVMLDNPRTTRSDAGAMVVRVCGDDIDQQAVNLINVLAENDRLAQLPMIEALYSRFRAEAEGTVEAEVISSAPLTDEQTAAIADALKKRLGRDVKLNCSVNENLVGGAIIRAGDLVIDGSAVERLRQLASALVH
jgi:F-type H+-transporting ATPase subunit delta